MGTRAVRAQPTTTLLLSHVDLDANVHTSRPQPTESSAGATQRLPLTVKCVLRHPPVGIPVTVCVRRASEIRRPGVDKSGVDSVVTRGIRRTLLQFTPAPFHRDDIPTDHRVTCQGLYGSEVCILKESRITCQRRIAFTAATTGAGPERRRNKEAALS